MSWFNPVSFNDRIGLIAGGGEFPLVFAEAAASIGKNLTVIGVEGYVDKRVEAFSKKTHYIGMGQLGKLVDLLKSEQIKQVVLAGAIPKKEIYSASPKMDETASAFVHQVENKGDDHLLRAFQLYLKTQCGVSIIDSRRYLKEILAPRGVLTKRQPTADEWSDLKFGYQIAKGVGKLDIGQTVVVKKGVVLAVEALEGTNQAIRRGAELGNGSVVVVKVSKPRQDLRFDLPCVGLETLEVMRSASSSVLGVESGKTLMLFKEKMVESANQNHMAVVGF